MDSLRTPLWLRLVLVIGVVVLVGGAAFFAYRWYTYPTTLTVAVGSLDGEAERMMSAIAGRLGAVKADVRLNVVKKPSVLEATNAFSSDETDLAVVRGDVGDLSEAQAILIVAHAVALLIAPPGSSFADVTDLKRMVVGVVSGEANRKVVSALTNEYDLTRANVTFKDVPPADARRFLESKEVRAILTVLPLTEKYIALLREMFRPGPKSAPVLIPIEAAGAIAGKERAYESFDVPKGTLRGSPALPGEDLTTLRVSYYLVAKKKLDNDVVTSLTEAVMNARRDLLGELPGLAQITAASTDADAYLSAHPGAAAFYNGTQQSFLDKWGNAIFLAPMILGGLASVLAAGWKFLRSDERRIEEHALDALYALGRRIRTTERLSELADIEEEIDRVLQAQRDRATSGDGTSFDAATVNVAAHRLEVLIHDRRVSLGLRSGDKAIA